MAQENDLKEDMLSQPVERIKKAVAYLISTERVSHKSTQKDIAEKMGAAIANVSRAFNGNERYLTEGFLKRFNTAFDGIFNEEWLLEGVGNMLTSYHQEKENIIEITADDIRSEATSIRTQGKDIYLETSSGIKYFELSDNKYRMRVPLVPFNAYARYICEACDTIQQEREEWDEVEFIVDKIGHGNYMAFEIKGDSMNDDSRRSFIQGDLVLARELDKVHWKDGIRYNQYPFWIIVLNNTILCKEIINHNIETGDITCHSLNPSPEYADFTVNLGEVCRLFNIVQRTSTAF